MMGIAIAAVIGFAVGGYVYMIGSKLQRENDKIILEYYQELASNEGEQIKDLRMELAVAKKEIRDLETKLKK